MDSPLAYHLTFGTYGTRLHGDPRGTVIRDMNRPGDPILGRNEDRQQMEHERLSFPPVRLTPPERCAVEALIPEICERGDWRLHVCAAQPDHVHTLLSAPPTAEAKTFRRLLKRWLHQWMDERFPGAIPRPRPAGCAPPRGTSADRADATWWAECGSIRWAWTRAYYENIYGYIQEQRATP